MAVQIESRGQIQDFLDVLRRRGWQIAVPAIFVLTIGSCLAVIIPRKFVARTQLELRQLGPTLVGKEGGNAQNQIMAPARIKSIVEDKLRPPAYQALSEADRIVFLKDIEKNLQVVPTAPSQQSSVFIRITYADVDRVWAGAFLKALRDDWQEDVLEQDRNKLQDEVQRLGAQRNKLEQEWKKEEEELAELKKKNGLSALQIPGMGNQQNDDPEYTRLQTHRGQVAEYAITLAQEQGTLQKLKTQLEALPAKVTSQTVLPGSTHAKEIQDLDAKISAARRRLQDYKPLHSAYVGIQKEIRDLETHRDELEASVTSSEFSSVNVENPALVDVRKQIAEAEGRIAGWVAKKKSLEETISREAEDVSNSHEIYREVRERENKIQLYKNDLTQAEASYQAKVQQSQIAQSPKNNPFAILEEVSVPPKATEPNPWLIVAASLAAGLGLGVGIAILLEYTKSCFRSVYDISRVMPVPVLGNINRIVTRRERRHRTTRRILVGTATVLILGSLAFVTWAWAHDQESGLLSPALRKAIEGLRAALK